MHGFEFLIPFPQKIIFFIIHKIEFLAICPQKLNKHHVKSCLTVGYDLSDSLQKLNKNY